MPDTPHHLEEDHRQGLIDRFFKRLMPNGTVIRRFVAASYVCGVVAGFVGLHLIDETDSNTQRGTEAICAVLSYAEDAAAASRAALSNTNGARPTPGAVVRLEELAQEMRNTGVSCPPPPRPE